MNNKKVKKRWIMGIDPGGVSGCIVYISVSGSNLHVYPMPHTEELIEKLIENYAQYVALCGIEEVHSFPRDGVVSAFSFGSNFGLLKGCLLSHKIPFIKIQPKIWQKKLNCLTGGDKRITRDLAQRIFPKVKFTLKTADAALIALYTKKYGVIKGV